MIARDLVTDEIPSLKPSDTGYTARLWMMEFQVKYLPITQNDTFLGLISEDEIFDLNDELKPIGEYNLQYWRPYVLENEHIVDVFRKAAELKTSVVPVVDNREYYKGAIYISSLLQKFAEFGFTHADGAVLVLHVPERAHSLSEITSIAEAAKIPVHALLTREIKHSSALEIVLRLGAGDLPQLIREFDRGGYQVVDTFFRQEGDDELLQDRYNSLMNFLKI